ncbi:MAG: hypothetical protein LAO03_04310 [Acidobacteriia bacterium]|nr:hypothetical protein [Terriglobia bacterium]
MKTKSSLSVLLLLFSVFTHICAAESQAAAAFQKIKSLAGQWEGKDDDGKPAKTNFQVVVAGTAVLETLSMSGMEDMLTVYSVDGDGVALIHYCPTNNQPRMRALPGAGNLMRMELNFIFRDAGNMPVPTTGHQQKLDMRVEDENHITESWTWRQNGHDSVQTIHFTRSK